MRGIEWTYVPTTLMSMVDSCIGGKSSINVANYKNIIGNIYPPQEIQIYTDFTNTLSAIDIVAGELEAIKICFARGQNSFDKFVQLLNDSKTDPLALPGLISHVINSKKHFVEEDEFDKGIRQLLNFGHTFGHALESASNYRIPHGVAIGIGMLAAKDFAKSDRSDYHERLVQNVLKIFSRIPDLLPQMIETVDFGLFETAFKADKKHTAENFALIVPVMEELQMIWVARSEENLELVNRSLKTALEQLEALS
jgi:3-dehydroquinate synthase